MNNYKATPEQWAGIKKDSRFQLDSCILELCARVEALEALANHFGDINKMVPPSVATDEELDKLWNSEDTWNGSLRALYNLGVAHGQAGSREVAVPGPVAEGLVERVSRVIGGIGEGGDWSPEARAAILDVARWLREQGTPASGWAMRLEQEAGR